MQSIKQVSEKIDSDLQRYLEATYHLRHPRLIKERRALMSEGETSTEPWVEATPSYVAGKHLRNLDLPKSVVSLLKELESHNLDVFDPPYRHQADALEAFFDAQKDLIVSTGTGSGKTEIFLYSILGQLAQEAQRNVSTQHRGIRTLVLYPMNALVADQLSRMRLLFGDEDGADTLEERMGRRVQFGMYTSRTPYHGEYDTDKNEARIKPIVDRYLHLQRNNIDLYEKLEQKGRIPTKDLEGFRNYGASKETQFRTRPGDTELFTRQEMHSSNEYGGTPDILITNYSMLEYMLLRPIEQPLFQDTREWLQSDEENELTVVLDEAHLYRGAQGAEVALLLSRLLQKLDISRDRVRFILTSATMGDKLETAAPEFAAQLTTGEPDEFELIEGKKETYVDGSPVDNRIAEILARIKYDIDDAKIRNLAAERDWEALDTADTESTRRYLAEQLRDDSLFHLAHKHLRDEPLPLSDLAVILFPGVEEDLAQEATGNLLYLCTEAQRDGEQALLPTRLHMFLKGLPAQYACVNPECSGRRATDEENLLGRIYTNPHTTCSDCGSRVFELLSHRTCGAAYLRAYRRTGNSYDSTFLWTDPENSDDLDELHLLVEQPRSDPDPKHEHHRSLLETIMSRKLDITSGYLVDDREVSDESKYIDVWVPSEEPENDNLWSWTRCPACGIQERRLPGGRTKVQDLVTKGEEPFANIVRSMFEIQPEDDSKGDLPNRGKKVLCFSDGRQKAARLARDLQGNVELDSFREVVSDIISEYDGELTMDEFFAEFVVYCTKHNIVFFDDRDEYISQRGTEYPGSRSRFEEIQQQLSEIIKRYPIETIEEIPQFPPARQEISNRPRQFNSMILRSLGDEYYSIPASLIGYLRPIESVVDEIIKSTSTVDEDLLRGILIEVLQHACEERAFDKDIEPYQRAESLPYGWITESDQGLEYTEIIPDFVREAVGNTVSDEEWDSIQQSLLMTSPALFEPIGNGNYAVAPTATTVELRLDESWYRCDGCYQFSVVSLNGVCPHSSCNGTLVEVGEDDIHLQARKNFLRVPPMEVAKEERNPFTLRSEEHSAQLSAKDFSDAFSRSEMYELLFQDILIGGSKVEQPIDVLSCTTTMEVGIDIGSLTGVAMRTVPPAPNNYEQRAGRAGRRGAGLSTIVTFADNSPHESHYFQNPSEMVGASGNAPIIYAGNKKIAQRHINASLLARFFDSSAVKSSADVFGALDTSSAFFAGTGPYSLTSFTEWVTDQILEGHSRLLDDLEDLLPDELGGGQDSEWRTRFIRETANEFLVALEKLRAGATWEEDDNDEDLLTTLLDAALLPTFSFPIDVCDFTVSATDRNGIPKTKYEMSRDLKQALSTYAPGREIVVDKKTYESYGVFFKFAEDRINRADGVEWESLKWLNFCPRCETIYDEQDENLGEQDVTCTVCEADTLASIRMFTPPAFAPEVDKAGRPEEGSGYNEDHVSATAPKYPLTLAAQDSEGADEMPDEKQFGPSSVGRLKNEQLLVANFGPDDGGFDVCTKCGAVGADGNLSNPHNRPYPKDIRSPNISEWSDQCSGSTVRTSFSHLFPSDLTVLRIPLKPPMEFVPSADWFESGGQSLAEALVMGASRALGIEDSELEGGFRTRSADLGCDSDVRGYIEIFLFDTTAGGAGFSSKVWEEFDAVLEEARKILGQCKCDTACHNCLRRYQNRYLHRLLNRHQGLALLDYAETGRPPELSNDKIVTLIERLGSSLKLQNSDVEISPSETRDDVYQVNLDESIQTIGIRSCLRESRVTGEGAFDHDYSDHDLSHHLPEVAHRLMEQLE